MTGTYDWNPMPHKVDIKCPVCSEHSVFEFAEVVKIEFKKDVPFFEQSDLFEYSMFKDSCGHKWHGAIYFANLHGGSTEAIHSLPEGYSSENWAHSKYLIRNHGFDLGAFCCSYCQTRKPYILQWMLFILSRIKVRFFGRLTESLQSISVITLHLKKEKPKNTNGLVFFYIFQQCSKNKMPVIMSLNK